MKHIFSLLLISISLLSYSQSFKSEWVKTIKGSSHDYVEDIVKDSDGNIYYVGQYLFHADFDPSADSLILTAEGDKDVFILKTDGAGNLIWAKSFGSRGTDNGNAIHLDKDGNILVGGYFEGISNIDPLGRTPDYAGRWETTGFVAKFSSTGNHLWTALIEGDDEDEVWDVTTDTANNVYMTGVYEIDVDLDPGVGEVRHSSNGNSVSFIEKLDKDGNYVWGHVIKNSSSNASYGFKIVENKGSIYWLGGNTGSFDFDFGSGSAVKSNEGVALLKMNLNSEFEWVRHYRTEFTPFNNSYSLVFDDLENLYVLCDLKSFLVLEEGTSYPANSYNQFVEKITDAGSPLWTDVFSSDTSFNFFDMQLDADKNLVLVGGYSDNFDVDPSAGVMQIESQSLNSNLLLLQLDNDGQYHNHKAYGRGASKSIKRVLPVGSGEYIVTGEVYDSVNLSPLKGGKLMVYSQGSSDVFFQKLSACAPTYGVDSLTACDSLTWIDGITYYDNDTSAQFCLVNSTGCDSVVTLNLAVTTLDLTVVKDNDLFVSQEQGALYQWLDCTNNHAQLVSEVSATYQASGTGSFAVEVMKNGCIDTTVCVGLLSKNDIFGLIAGGGTNDYARAVTSDSDGNLYVTGVFNETIDFDPGSGVTELTPKGISDVFVLKFTASGTLVWAKAIGGNYGDAVQNLAVDHNGNVIVVGQFYGTFDFDPSASDFNLTVSGVGMYVTKLDSDGDFLWAKAMASDDETIIQSVAVDSENNIIYCGTLQDSTDMNPDPLITDKVVSAFNRQAQIGFVSKLDASGNLIWNKIIEGEVTVAPLKVVVTPDDGVATLGYASAGMDIDPGPNFEWIKNSSTTDRKIFLQRLTKNGDYLWGKTYGSGKTYCSPSGLAIDPQGNVVFTYYADGTGSTSDQTFSFYIQKLMSDGSQIWKTKIDNKVSAMAGFSSKHRGEVSINDGGEIAVGGVFSNTSDSLGITSIGWRNGFISTVDNNGNVLNTQTLGGTGFDILYDLVMENSGDITVVGEYQLTATINGVQKTSNGGTDFFIQRLRACPPVFLTDSIFSCRPYTWKDGKTYSSNNNIAAHTISTVGTCDTIITLNLTVQTLSRSISVIGNELSFDVENDTIQWLDCSNNYAVIPNENDSIYNVGKSESYSVEVRSGQCIDTTSCETVIIVHNVQINQIDFQINPNPTEGILNIKAQEKGVTYKLTSLDGKNMRSFIVNDLNTQLDLSDLTTGVYLLKGSKDGKILVKKVIVK